MASIPWSGLSDLPYEAARDRAARQLSAIYGLANAAGTVLGRNRRVRREHDERLGELARAETYSHDMYSNSVQKAAEESATQQEKGRPPGESAGDAKTQATIQSTSENDSNPPASTGDVPYYLARPSGDVQSSQQPSGSSPVSPPTPNTTNVDPVPATKAEATSPSADKSSLNRLAEFTSPVTKPVMAAGRGLWDVIKPDQYTLGNLATQFGLNDPRQTQEFIRLGTALGQRDVVEGEQRRLGTILQYGRPTDPSKAIPKLAPHAFGGLDLSGIQWTDWSRRGNAHEALFDIALKAAGGDYNLALQKLQEYNIAIRQAQARGLSGIWGVWDMIRKMPPGPERDAAMASLEEFRKFAP